MLPNSIPEASITLIQKSETLQEKNKNKNYTLVSPNYTSVSLINMYFKILNKILAQKLVGEGMNRPGIEDFRAVKIFSV